MIDNIQNNQIVPPMGMSSGPQPDRTSKPAEEGLDATLQVRFADLIHQANGTSQMDTDAVRKAKELLQSGRLTSPENLRSAAESIVMLGI
jgi:hypothetical protein